MNKRAISPVVATGLLLVVAVVAVVSFQSWFDTYSSSVFVDVEERSDVGSLVSVEGIIGNSLYLKSGSADVLSVLKIVDSDGVVMCEMSDGVESDLQGDTRLLMTFDDGTATDLSGYGNNGTLNGGVDCSAQGVSGRGCEFDGVDSTYIEGTNQLGMDNSFTISLWFKVNSLFEDAYYGLTNGLIYYGDNSAATMNYALLINNDSDVSFLKRTSPEGLFFHSYDSGNIGSNWNNIIFSYDDTLARTYMNSQKIGEEIIVNLEYKSFHKLIIGKIGLFAIMENTTFNGVIDEVAIYSKALTQDEVQALYNAQKAKFYEELLPSGVKEIDVNSCNLQKGQVYEVVAFTDSQRIVEKVVAK